jgi:uncharacterized protein involved in propanediol utilization
MEVPGIEADTHPVRALDANGSGEAKPQTSRVTLESRSIKASAARNDADILFGSWPAYDFGFAASHCGELFQGPVIGPDGTPVTGVITLPDPRFWAAAVIASRTDMRIEVDPPACTKVRKAVELALQIVKLNSLGFTVHVFSNIPQGVGMGSSTAQCVAAVRAVLQIARRTLTDIQTLKLVYQVEGPCDPLTATSWGTVLIWASRDGFALEVIEEPLPRMAALGFVTDQQGVSTDELARTTVYSPSELDTYARILELAKQAIRSGSAADLGKAAVLSADANQHRCATVHWNELNAIADRMGAVGVAVSHSGTAAAILWSIEQDALRDRIDDASARLTELSATNIHCFGTA